MSIDAVARRASFAEGSRGREAPLWESRGRSPLERGEVATKTQPIQIILPNKPIPQNAGLPKKRRTLKSRNPNQMCRPNPAPHFQEHVLLMSVKTAKSEAILRRTNIKPNKGDSPCPRRQCDYNSTLSLYGCLLVLRFSCVRSKACAFEGVCLRATY